MKKLVLLFAATVAISFASCGNQASKTKSSNSNVNITLKGSDTCLPLSQKFAETYINEHPDAYISVAGGGTGVGFSALQANTTDIAMASRKIKMDEEIALQEQGNEVEEFIIAYDALAVVVNPSNPVNQLTRQQLEDIFTGKTTNWSEVGGENMKIVVYSRETSSGTYEFFREEVLLKKNFTSSSLSLPATGAIIQSVSQTPGAIGYVGIAYVDNKTKALAVSYDDVNFVVPSVETAKDKSYPITRALYYYYLSNNKEKVAPLVDFIASDEGQAVVLNEGYVPVR
jgi:phosphate transport system substrate-binding protein